MTGKNLRKTTGSVICEFGAAVWLLVIGFMFPCLEMTGLFTSYGCCWVLNHMQAEQAALLSQGPNQGLITQQLPQTWAQSGIGQLANLQAPPKTNLNFQDNSSVFGAVGGPSLGVSVTTTFSIKPVIQVPIFGLNQPIQFTISSQRLVEDPNAVQSE